MSGSQQLIIELKTAQDGIHMHMATSALSKISVQHQINFSLWSPSNSKCKQSEISYTSIPLPRNLKPFNPHPMQLPHLVLLLLELFTLQKSLPALSNIKTAILTLVGGLVGWRVILYTKGCKFDSWSGHMPRLWVRYLVVVCTGGTQLMFFTSMFLPLPLPLSLKIYNISSCEDLKKKQKNWHSYGSVSF